MILALGVSCIIYAFIPPLLDGVERKLKASIQSRVGPPTVFQTWYDLLKLFSKEVVSHNEPTFFVVALPASLTLVLSLSIAITYVVVSFPNLVANVPERGVQLLFLLSLIMVLTISTHTMHALIYTVSSNPFSIIGTFRALTLDLLNEVMFVTSLALVYGLNIARSFEVFTLTLSPIVILPLFTVAFLSLIISVYVSSRRLPYDLHEAEPELASGSIIELSGPLLGLYVYSHLVERYTLTSIPVSMFILALIRSFNPLAQVLALHLGTSFLFLLFGLVSFTIGRSRVDLALRTIALLYVFFILIYIGVYIFGYIYK